MPSPSPVDNRLTIKPAPARQADPFPWAQFVLLLLAISAAGWCYYRLYWKYRLPQEHVLTTTTGEPLPVRIEQHTAGLLLLTPLPNGAKQWYPVMEFSKADQDYISSLAVTPLTYPIDIALTNAAGKKETVRLLGRSENLVKFLASDGTNHMVPLKTLPEDDQPTLQSLPTNLDDTFPLDNWPLTLRNGQKQTVRLTGRTNAAVQFLVPPSTDRHYFTFSALAESDAAYIQSLPADLSNDYPITCVLKDKTGHALNVKITGRSSQIVKFTTIATDKIYEYPLDNLSDLDRAFVSTLRKNLTEELSLPALPTYVQIMRNELVDLKKKYDDLNNELAKTGTTMAQKADVNREINLITVQATHDISEIQNDFSKRIADLEKENVNMEGMMLAVTTPVDDKISLKNRIAQNQEAIKGLNQEMKSIMKDGVLEKY